jgi:hypothetical protein
MNTMRILPYRQFTTTILAEVGVFLRLAIDSLELGDMYDIPL